MQNASLVNLVNHVRELTSVVTQELLLCSIVYLCSIVFYSLSHIMTVALWQNCHLEFVVNKITNNIKLRMAYFTTFQQNCRKVMFSFVYVCSLVVSNVTITHDALNITTGSAHHIGKYWEALKPWSPTSGIWWSGLKTCSNLFTWNPPRCPNWTDIWRLLKKHAQSAQVGGTHPTGMPSH